MRLIDADAALALIKQLRNKDKNKNNYLRLYACNFAMSTLGNPEQTPTISPEDCRAQGRWISDEGDVLFHCSECETQISTSWDYDDLNWNYCPNCGARMNGKEQGE